MTGTRSVIDALNHSESKEADHILQNWSTQEGSARSQFVNTLLNKAARHPIIADAADEIADTHHLMTIGEESPQFYLVTRNEDLLKKLEEYNPAGFKNKFELSENVYALELSTDVLRKRVAGAVLNKVPGWHEAIKADWHHQDILQYQNNLPMIALRLYAGITLSAGVTASDFRCDSTEVISQQLFNYANTIQTTLLPLQFPEEGRNAIFRFNHVPFHKTNAKSYNDELCQFMGLFTIDREAGVWPINKSFPTDLNECIQRVDLNQNSAYRGFTAINKIVTKGSYDQAFMLPLDRYIEHSLRYQRSLKQGDRIQQENHSYATDAELDSALSYFSKSSVPEPSAPNNDNDNKDFIVIYHV